MIDEFRTAYAPHLSAIKEIINAEPGSWSAPAVAPLLVLLSGHLRREGKMLRPLLVLVFAELFEGQLERVYHVAAALEVYHTATLIFDDIQDNSEFRRGLPCAHVSNSTSTALNLAAVTRSLMYHYIHRAPLLTTEEKLAAHQRLDEAATNIALGQSIDIGWHEGWYPSYRDFAYGQMIDWKTAQLFSCAAALGAQLAAATAGEIVTAAEFGLALGRLFQKVDDYADVFADPQFTRRPLYNDFREGKMSLPVLLLLAQLERCGRTALVELILERLNERRADESDWSWLIALMDEHGIAAALRHDLIAEADLLRVQAARLGTAPAARRHLLALIDSMLAALVPHKAAVTPL